MHLHAAFALGARLVRQEVALHECGREKAPAKWVSKMDMLCDVPWRVLGVALLARDTPALSSRQAPRVGGQATAVASGSHVEHRTGMSYALVGFAVQAGPVLELSGPTSPPAPGAFVALGSKLARRAAMFQASSPPRWCVPSSGSCAKARARAMSSSRGRRCQRANRVLALMWRGPNG
jgi:hypothetical protein